MQCSVERLWCGKSLHVWLIWQNVGCMDLQALLSHAKHSVRIYKQQLGVLHKSLIELLSSKDRPKAYMRV